VSDELTKLHSITLARLNFYVFDQNYQQLKDLIEYANEPEHVFTRFHDVNERQAILTEMARLLHNFIASARSLVDYTRILMNKRYAETDFYTPYQDNVNTIFVNNHLAGFIEGLRNYILHYSLPFGTAHLSMTVASEENEGSVNYSFSLNKADLQQWDGWKPNKGRPYLDNAGAEIDIGSLIDDYYKKVVSIQVWTYKHVWVYHARKLGADTNNLPNGAESIDHLVLELIAYFSKYAYGVYFNDVV
jgi:hypothetical protein